MSEKSTFTLTVTYTDGTKETFDLLGEPDATMLASRLNQTVSGTALLLALEDSFLAIPWTSIKYVEISPALPSLPASVLKHVRRVSSD